MNFLAHAYLSFHHPEILAGNMISDFVKGKKKFDYSAAIQKGIALHRAIDTFTDTHEATLIAKEFFKPVYRLYAGAFIDVVYDYYLANDTNEFAGTRALELFAAETYQELELSKDFFPDRFKMMFPYMRKQNWLLNYRYEQGLKNSFEGLVRRATYIRESDSAFNIFQQNFKALNTCYNNFFPSLKIFAQSHLQLLMKD